MIKKARNFRGEKIEKFTFVDLEAAADSGYDMIEL